MAATPERRSPPYPSEIRELFKLSGQGIDPTTWLIGAESAVEFLKANALAGRVVIYASLPFVFIHGVLAPLKQLKEPDQRELGRGFVEPHKGWCIEHSSGGGRPDRVYLASPMDGEAGSLRGGEKLIFRRSWPGAKRASTEISQKLVHALDLHFVDERNAYCRIDESGDIESVISIIDLPSEKWGESIVIITITALELWEYARLAGMGAMFLYDFTRYAPGFGGWSNQQRFEHSEPHLFYHGGVQAGTGSYVYGRQIVIPCVTQKQIVARYMNQRTPQDQSYATFKAIDLKTGDRIEVSCAEKALSNYFQKDSPLPLEMSPVFFNAEVLHRYKADPAKYDLADRSISCRGAWYLKTYDVNDEGQVHTYLRYLRDLPYREQIYWQSFNEWPKGHISKRAFQTDFMGEWDTGYDALREVKRKVQRLDEIQPEWWGRRGEEIAKAVHPPVTGSEAEWSDAILSLDQLVKEAFVEKPLKEMLVQAGRPVKDEWRSLTLMEELLVLRNASPAEAKMHIKAIRNMSSLRNIVKGHAAPAKKAAAAQRALKEHGTFRAHFESLAAACDDALGFIMRQMNISAD